MNLPYDIIYEIINYNPLYLNKHIFLSNKFFYKIYSEKYLENIKFIQKRYRKYRLPHTFLYPNSFLIYYDFIRWQELFNKNNKMKIYRYLITKLTDRYLMKFPNIVLQKAFIHDSSRYLIVKDWINNNLPRNYQNRKRSDILKFFIENRITFKEINDTGI